MLQYGYCSICNEMLIPIHLEEHRQDHHSQYEVIFLRLYSDQPKPEPGPQGPAEPVR